MKRWAADGSAAPAGNASGRRAAAASAPRQLGTDQAGIDALTNLFITRGDFVRVNTTIANRGPDGGTNRAAAFPNGRRLGDDVIDFTLSVVTNGNPAASSDNVEDDTGNRRRNVFPFVAPPIQPFESADPRAESRTNDLTQN
jgi:hypothetical protein